jgi:hypothetical protein
MMTAHSDIIQKSKETLTRIQKSWYTDLDINKAEIYLCGETILQRFSEDTTPDMDVLSPTTDNMTFYPPGVLFLDKQSLTTRKCKTTEISVYELICLMMHETIVWPTWGTICSVVVSTDAIKTKLKTFQRSVTRTIPLHKIAPPFSYRPETNDSPTGGFRLTVISCPQDRYSLTVQEEKWA